jgi:hypothetical protein
VYQKLISLSSEFIDEGRKDNEWKKSFLYY